MPSKYLAGLSAEQRAALEKKLCDRQAGKCFICDGDLDLVVQKGTLEVDHIDPLAADGLDAENNFALTHGDCNRNKGSSDLVVARRIAEFDRLQARAQKAGKRGANLGDVLEIHSGAREKLRLRRDGDSVLFALPGAGSDALRRAPIVRDKLSGMESFFTVLPLQYLHHDDRINPRSIGANIRGLLEEFQKKRPQLHVALAWWAPDEDQSGLVKVFDGQHKAAAQILLGVRELPLRVFLEPDTDILLEANTNAGSKLRQVAFDVAVMRHLGSSLYLERVRHYQAMNGLEEGDLSFSEQRLVNHFHGAQKEMEKYIIDAQRDLITRHPKNRLTEFIEWAGKGADRPISYTSIERSFFKELLYKRALDTPINHGLEEGQNARELEREQMVGLMSLCADSILVGQWDPDLGGRRLEDRLRGGEKIPPDHLRAWRMAREEVLATTVRWLRRVIEHYNAHTGQFAKSDRLLHTRLPPKLWENLRNFLEAMARLPCWVDVNMSGMVFGAKRSPEYWEKVFDTGRDPSGAQVLAEPLNVMAMIQDKAK